MTEEFCKKTGLTTAQIEGDTAKAASSTITIRSRCHEAGGDWRPEPGSPKYMRDLMAAKRRAAKQPQSKEGRLHHRAGRWQIFLLMIMESVIFTAHR